MTKVVKNNLQKQVNINIDLLNVFLLDKDKRTFAYWTYLKHLYTNGTIYNFSFKSLSKKSGLSRRTLSRHIKNMLKLGLATMHKGNLTFKSKDKINKEYNLNTHKKRNYKIKYKTIKELVSQIHLVVLKEQGKRQEYIYNLKESVSDTSKSKWKVKKQNLKKLRNNFNLNRYESKHNLSIEGYIKNANKGFTIGLEKISKLYNCSIANAYLIVCGLEKSGHLSIKRGRLKKLNTSTALRQFKNDMNEKGNSKLFVVKHKGKPVVYHHREANQYLLN